MNIQDVIERIQGSGVNFKLKNGQIYIQGVQSDIDADVLALIKSHKEGLINWLKRAEQDLSLPKKIAIERNVHPLSSAQKRIWFTHKLEGTSAQYNMIYAWELTGALDISRLNEAIHKVILEHPALRTVFTEEEGEPKQIIFEKNSFTLGVIDCPLGGDNDFHQIVENYLKDEGEQSFSLTEGSLLRGILLRQSALKSALILTIHHIGADGWSEGIIKKAISDYYNNPEKDISLVKQRFNYTDYIYYQETKNYTSDLYYWKRQLSSLSTEVGLPTDNVRPDEQKFKGTILRTRIKSKLYTALRTLFQDQKLTPYIGLYTCFSLFISQVTKNSDVVIGTPVAGREHTEFSDVVGFFVNTLVLRTKLNQGDSLRVAFDKCKATVLDALSHQSLPFDTLVEALQPIRSLDRHPLFQIMFAFQNNDHGNLTLDGIQSREIEEVCPKVIFDLQLDLREADEGLDLEWRYNTDLFEVDSIRILMDAFEEFLIKVSNVRDFTVVTPSVSVNLEHWSNRITRLLQQHDDVKQAVVGQHFIDGQKHIVACVVPNELEIKADYDSEQLITEWGALFDDVYKKGDCSDFDIIGWDSSYTGNPIPRDEMVEWLDNTIYRILSLSPRKIFEIGTGTGLLLYRLVSHCETYFGIDPSETIIERHQSRFQSQGVKNASVKVGCAHKMNELDLGSIDTVVINSVAQYFPSLDYLEDVINHAVDAIDTGNIFVGDVCDFSVQHEFYLSLDRYNDPAQFGESSTERLTEILHTKSTVERELMVSPEFFVRLQEKNARITGVDILPKEGNASNEMTRFRYDVIIVIGEKIESPVLSNIQWSKDWMLESGLSDFVLKGYPNLRMLVEAQVIQSLRAGCYDSQVYLQALKANENVLSIEKLHELARTYGYCLSVQLNINPTTASKTFDLVFTQSPLPTGGYVRPELVDYNSREHATQPSYVSLFLASDHSSLKESLRASLSGEIQPTYYIFVKSLPSLDAETFDWRGLLDAYSNYKHPVTVLDDDIKSALSLIWRDVLRLDSPVGFTENFFDLGGHSLLAMRLVSAASKLFDIELTVRDIFIAQTIDELAGLIQQKLNVRDASQELICEDGLSGGISL
ncbi:condensation domain-containing protein [Dickeya zeae]|uniref:condensation domain-containing protein n=1 Tax=Dickeya zeae TaxID=204042 RepID=UPI00039ED84F|nr:condensation domain-containing protein [Dickeya zeae]MCA6987029.1 condensation domain-containing protein [Dickeya zeae]